METTEYKLKRKLQYTGDSGFVDAEFIELREPSHTNPENYYKLNDMLAQGQIGMQKAFVGSIDLEEAKEHGIVGEQEKLHEQEPMTDEEIGEEADSAQLGIANAGLTHKFQKVFMKMVKLSKVKCALVDGDVLLNETIMSQMHPDDQCGLIFWWIAFFVTASDERKKRLSEAATDSLSTVTEL
jgi:hypothetical protein